MSTGSFSSLRSRRGPNLLTAVVSALGCERAAGGLVEEQDGGNSTGILAVFFRLLVFGSDVHLWRRGRCESTSRANSPLFDGISVCGSPVCRAQQAKLTLRGASRSGVVSARHMTDSQLDRRKASQKEMQFD